VTKELFLERWNNVDRHELRLLLAERIGGPGQYANQLQFPSQFHLPLAGSTCQVIVKFKHKKVNSIEPGDAFDINTWNITATDIDKLCAVGVQQIAREFSFCNVPVLGSWLGKESGIQICPAPLKAPRPDQIFAENPFILEFPIQISSIASVDAYRRQNMHQKYTSMLNLFLNRRILLQSVQPKHSWSITRLKNGDIESAWSQQGYFAELGPVLTKAHSVGTWPEMILSKSEEYNSFDFYRGDELSISDELDDLICHYQRLSTGDLEKVDRAAYWFDLSSHQGNLSLSASFVSLVSAIESFVGRGEIHKVKCRTCDVEIDHEVPGALARFRAFLEQYAPGHGLKKDRDKMYDLRSSIAHGSDLFLVDQNRDFGWDPPGSYERELFGSLWRVSKVAIRNWLKSRQMTASS
jgi:hypothetical protein